MKTDGERLTGLVERLERRLSETLGEIRNDPSETVRVGALMAAMSMCAISTFLELVELRDAAFAETAFVTAFQAVKEELEKEKEGK
jgi:hypothetical protein